MIKFSSRPQELVGSGATGGIKISTQQVVRRLRALFVAILEAAVQIPSLSAGGIEIKGLCSNFKLLRTEVKDLAPVEEPILTIHMFESRVDDLFAHVVLKSFDLLVQCGFRGWRLTADRNGEPHADPNLQRARTQRSGSQR